MDRTNSRKLWIILGVIAVVLIAAIVIVCVLVFGGEKNPSPSSSAPSDTPSSTSSVPAAPTVTVERWLANEISFTSTVEYEWPYYGVVLDVLFKNADTGTEFTMPAFWDGGSTWKVRYALTEEGTWSYRTVCSDEKNTGLMNQNGAIICKPYSGDLEIYKRGFVKTDPDKRYFVYDDGTPFFYLGDTHWHMALEELDSNGDYCDDDSITSRFKYTIDTRVEQGFTVIQSEPLGEYTASDGNNYFHGIFDIFSEELLEQFQYYDRYFAYIAEKGLVHANAQFSYADVLGKYMNTLTDDLLEKLCRYWVARYGAYPVMWTMAQECDDDYYHDRGDQPYFDAETNPWKKVAAYVYKHDPYKHPLTAHQENAVFTKASNSAFRNVEGHTWYAAQFQVGVGSVFPNNGTFRDYWLNGQGKPAVLYESDYDHFWTGTTGARAQGWAAYLGGMYGYGYGSQKIWSANEKPGIWAGAIKDSISNGYDYLTKEDMDITWMESLQLPAAKQLGYMKTFLGELEWWKLQPTLGAIADFTADSISEYAMARDGSNTVVIYFLNKSTNTGTVNGLDDGSYQFTWFNPRTGEKTEPETVTAADGKFRLPNKPDAEDWVALLQKA